MGGAEAPGALTLVLLGLALLAEYFGVRFASRMFISGWDWCYLLALVYLGGPAALFVAWGTLLVSWAVIRHRLSGLLVNLAAVGLPIAIGSVVFRAFHVDSSDGASFALATAATTIVVLLAHVPLVLALIGILDGVRRPALLAEVRTLGPSLCFQAAFAVTITVLYATYRVEAVALFAVLIAAFAYMTRLVITARERTRQYANLSWGVLSGLIRTLGLRDARAARHCAAVARFARDMAREDGMDERTQELAHTAGLLHDIGKFALSDRVMDGSTELTDEDWRDIRAHPATGADLLRDLELYGPVAQIVGAHHERVDGRGYPARLAGEDIPAISRLVAVAEVYDTLTAPDTYRTPLSSFEALTELRRVAGTQLDPHYVEVLARVIAGRGVEYRHAGDADFDEELAIQRRVREAASMS